MKTLERQKQKFYFCTLLRKEPAVDASGYKTGEFVSVYTAPQEMRASISAGVGSDVFSKYGIEQTYDKVIETDDTKNLLEEGTVLFIGTEPTFDEHGTPQANWIIKKRIESLNSVTYGVVQIK